MRFPAILPIIPYTANIYRTILSTHVYYSAVLDLENKIYVYGCPIYLFSVLC